MKVFIYEFLTGGGTLSDPTGEPPGGSLLREGAAMIAALTDDFLQVDGVEVLALRDQRLGDFQLPGCTVWDVGSSRGEQDAFDRLVEQADATVLIAPEIDGFLLQRCRRVEMLSARLLSPHSEFVALTADKHRLGEHLGAAGIPMPQARLLAAGAPLPSDFPYPAVVKPRYGAGSHEIRYLRDAAADCDSRRPNSEYRLESYCTGTPVSLSLLCGPDQATAMPASLQRLSDEGGFQYLGGRTPLEPSLNRRATELALSAMDKLPTTQGYVGLDMVLGDDASGGDDVLIEINPRLTTSYVGLRAAARSNLADAMLLLAAGRPVELEFESRRVEFKSDGTVKLERGCGVR